MDAKSPPPPPPPDESSRSLLDLLLFMSSIFLLAPMLLERPRRMAPPPPPAGPAPVTCDPPPPCEGRCAEVLALIRSERASSSWKNYYESIAVWLERHGLEGGVMVEVGTAYGGLASHLLKRLPTLSVHAVDPFLFGYDLSDNMSNRYTELTRQYGDGLSDLWAEAMRHDLGGVHGCRYRLNHGMSADVAPLYAPRSVDAVFIDGDHQRAGVQTDLDAWRPVCKLRGSLIFNDFNGRFQGVMDVANDFARATGQAILVVPPEQYENRALFNLLPL
jgi:hypothetical protein